jgi:hypothetical protein
LYSYLQFQLVFHLYHDDVFSFFSFSFHLHSKINLLEKKQLKFDLKLTCVDICSFVSLLSFIEGSFKLSVGINIGGLIIEGVSNKGKDDVRIFKFIF